MIFMSKNSKSDLESRDSPVLFAGVKYYEVLMRNVTLIDEAALSADYEAWIRLLQNYYSKAAPYVNILNFKERLRKVKHKLFACRRSNTASNYNQVILSIEDELIAIQDELFHASRDLFVKPSTKDIEEFDIEELRGLKT